MKGRSNIWNSMQLAFIVLLLPNPDTFFHITQKNKINKFLRAIFFVLYLKVAICSFLTFCPCFYLLNKGDTNVVTVPPTLIIINSPCRMETLTQTVLLMEKRFTDEGDERALRRNLDFGRLTQPLKLHINEFQRLWQSPTRIGNLPRSLLTLQLAR